MEELINKKEYKLADNPKITIGFDNGSVFGSSGVNRYIGSYTIKNGSISFGNFGSTMMMGQKEDMDNETKYLKSLQESLPVKIDKENKYPDNFNNAEMSIFFGVRNASLGLDEEIL